MREKFIDVVRKLTFTFALSSLHSSKLHWTCRVWKLEIGEVLLNSHCIANNVTKLTLLIWCIITNRLHQHSCKSIKKLKQSFSLHNMRNAEISHPLSQRTQWKIFETEEIIKIYSYNIIHQQTLEKERNICYSSSKQDNCWLTRTFHYAGGGSKKESIVENIQ